MVRIAVAGGTGNVATEILRAPIASGHNLTILTRGPPSSHPIPTAPNITYKTVDYASLSSLTAALQGHDVVLSFLVVHQDTDCTVQKNLIHASIAAGVSRFAPAEWAVGSNSDIPPYANKDIIADYLADLESKGELRGMQYCLFQPGIFMEFFAHPYSLSPELITYPFFVDFEGRRAMVLDGGDQPFVLTAISDISRMLERTLTDGMEWPVVGSMRGARTSTNELLALGKKLRGGEWNVEYVKSEDIERGVLTASWVPIMSHPVIPDAERAQFSRDFVIMFLKLLLNGAWDVGGEWNERFPEFEFQGLEAYLKEAWEGRP